MQDPAQVLKIKEVRERKNLSQDEVVKRTGIPKRSYVNYENGITDIPFSKLQNIANALEVGIPLLISTEALSSEPKEKDIKAEEDKTSYPDLNTVRNEIRGDLKVILTGMTENFRVVHKSAKQMHQDHQKILRFIDDLDQANIIQAAKEMDGFLKARK